MSSYLMLICDKCGHQEAQIDSDSWLRSQHPQRDFCAGCTKKMLDQVGYFTAVAPDPVVKPLRRPIKDAPQA